jgi:hypothetical protein
VPPAPGRNAELLLSSGSLRQEQTSPTAAVIIGRVGLFSDAARRLFVVRPKSVVQAIGLSGRREANLDKSLVKGKVAEEADTAEPRELPII